MAAKSHSPHPDWATRHRSKGTELRLINKTYYLYAISSRWNSEKKRSQKITGPLLGKITRQEGFIPSSKQQLRKTAKLQLGSISVKEYGASAFILEHMKAYKDKLELFFPDQWRMILCVSFFRLLHQSPIKNMDFHFNHSFFSETFGDLSLSDKNVSALFRDLGNKRKEIVSFCKTFIQPGDHFLFDATDLISHSQNISTAKQGYNSRMSFESQLNLMFVFSTQSRAPVFYRLLPGNIKEVRAFKLSLQESGIQDAIIIADKGFHSADNVEQLQKAELNFIIPLKRNSSLVDYLPAQIALKKGFEGRFKHQERFIWYYTINTAQGIIHVFLNEYLKTEEEQDYLNRIESHPEDYTQDQFYEKYSGFGTLSVLTNLQKKKPQEIYALYKSRVGVETMFDAFKNILDADRTYMNNEKSMEGWLFINYLSLHWYYEIYRLLMDKKQNSKFSPADLLMHLAEVRKVKINDQWHLAETTRKTTSLLQRLGIPIT